MARRRPGFRRALDICQSLLLAMLLTVSFGPGRALAMDAEQKALYRLGVSAFDIKMACSVGISQSIDTNASQETNAKAVIGIAKTLDIGQQGALIGLMTALTESSLQNYANDGTYKDEDEDYSGTRLSEISQSLPHDTVGNDHDSVGIMQQRVTGGWAQMGGSYSNLNNLEVIKRLMTPAFAAEAFYKVLIGVPNWQSMDPGKAAQTVQVSAFPDRYNEYRPQAQSLLDKFWISSPAIDLPFPIDGGDATAANTQNPCSGAGKGAILATIMNFAWYDYRPAGTAGATTKRGDSSNDELDTNYAAAVNRASYKGDGCYGGGVDCGAFVTIVMRESGADPDYNKGNGNTTTQIAYLREATATGKYTRVTDKTSLQPGDIAIRADGDPFANRGGHTFFYVGTAISDTDPSWTGGQAASASQCERAPMAGPMDTFENYEWYHLN